MESLLLFLLILVQLKAPDDDVLPWYLRPRSMGKSRPMSGALSPFCRLQNHQLVRILVGVMPLTVLTSWEPHSGNVSLPYTMAHFITRALKQLCAPALMVPSKQTNKQNKTSTFASAPSRRCKHAFGGSK